MVLTLNFATTSQHAVTANTYYLLYTAPSKAMILGASVTCTNAAGFTGEMVVTTGGGSTYPVAWIIPPLTSVGYNNGLVETRKITLLSGYLVYIKCSLAISSGQPPDNGAFEISVVEGVT